MGKSESLNPALTRIKEIAYDRCSLSISELFVEPEGKEYAACRFTLTTLKIICRNAKITPKKNGQFVTFWRRNSNGVTEPYHEDDALDFYVITVTKENRIGQFVLPKAALIDHHILSTVQNTGKRGFRVYPDWDTPASQQAAKTQKWQTKYFIEIDSSTDLNAFRKLYHLPR